MTARPHPPEADDAPLDDKALASRATAPTDDFEAASNADATDATGNPSAWPRPAVRGATLAGVIAVAVAALLAAVVAWPPPAAWQRVPAPRAAAPAGDDAHAAQLTPPGTPVRRHADFGNSQAVSADAHRVADWVAASGDNGPLDIVLVDKRAARVYVFDAQARLQAEAPALLGAARGDLTVPGIGDRPLAQVRPEERTTPAGRFVAEPGVNSQGEDVVWVDYDAAVSMHRVRTGNATEQRLQRLATPGIDDNRISFGCINLPVAFYESQLRPRVHGGRGAVVYVLPEVLPLNQVFALPAG